MGRRWGKTYMAGVYALACADHGGAVAWVVPTYKNARAPWRFAEQLIARVARRLRVNRTERLIEFPSGGRLAVYSADNDTALRGEAFDVVIVDEAAMVGEETYTDVLLPTLADRDGRMLLISTPKGRNWFWREWVRGVGDGRQLASFQAPTADNPMPSIRRAAELARERVSERTYRQEWLAEFVEDGGEVFRGVQDLVRPPAPHGGPYVAGIDWGREHDYTVVTVIDAPTRQVVACDRWTRLPYEQQLGRVLAIAERYRPEIIVAEQNSMGGPLVERLFYEHELPIKAWAMTHQSKAKAIDALALACERQSLALPDLPWLLGELAAYTITKTSGLGLPTYGAPDGMHDDGVISLALAWQGALWFHGGDV